MAWPMQVAKQKFSEFVRKAVEEGPRVVTRYGEEVAVLVSAEICHKLSGKDFKTFLMEGAAFDNLEVECSRKPTRIVKQ